MSVTVLERAPTALLTTKERVRGSLGLSSTTPTDAQLDRFIAAASSRAATFCRRTFGREIVRERFEVGCRRLDETACGLLLDRSPVAEIKTVTVDGVLQPADAYEIDGRTLYRWDAGSRRCWWGGVVMVEYVAGWFLPGEAGTPPDGVEPLPADIEHAVIQLVGVALSASGRDAMVKSESVEGVGSQSFYVQGSMAALPHPEAEAILTEYRRVYLA